MSSLYQVQDDNQFDDDGLIQTYGVAEHDYHATLQYEDIVRNGMPARPLDFPTPKVFRSELIELRARDHRSGTIHHLKNVLLRSNSSAYSKHNNNNNNNNKNNSCTDTAYLITKKLSRTVYGSVCLCLILKRIKKSPDNNPNENSNQENRQDHDDIPQCSSVEWESTDLQAAVKISEWKKIHSLRGKHLADPIKEIAALDLLGKFHPHMNHSLEVLQDDKCLYSVMPYLSGGDLYGRLVEFMGCNRDRICGFDESSARIWFRQLLLAVDLLQKKGVCHRDICLENLLLDKDEKICLIDPGISLRVPYTDSQTGGIGDVSTGTSRRLMIAQGQGGKLMYTAPEIIEKAASVDPFATDLWAVGVVLFVMLVGLAPFEWAHPSDKRFANISTGGLVKVVQALDISISPEACDLLQGFFWGDPNKRFSLAEIMHHPWVQGKEFIRRLSLSCVPKKESSTKSKRNIKFGSFGSLDLKKKMKGKKSSLRKHGNVQDHFNNEGHSDLNRHLHLLNLSH